MKQPRKLKRNEKIMLSRKKLNPEEWMVQSEDKESIIFVHKTSKTTRKFEKQI